MQAGKLFGQTHAPTYVSGISFKSIKTILNGIKGLMKDWHGIVPKGFYTKSILQKHLDKGKL